MTKNQKKPSRMHSKNPADAAWRAQQCSIDSDIEGLSRDPQAEQLVAEMDAAGIDVEQQIERLKAYFIARRDRT